MATPVLITIKDGLVIDVQICKSAEDIENKFVEANIEYGRETNNVEMDDGFVDLENGISIQMCWGDMT